MSLLFYFFARLMGVDFLRIIDAERGPILKARGGASWPLRDVEIPREVKPLRWRFTVQLQDDNATKDLL